jgi:nucleoside-diphosphate-sugar epimerase
MAPPISLEDLQHIQLHTQGLWDEMRGQRIFITGGTGFFGCWLLESFAYINRVERLSAHATVLSRDPAAFAEKCPHLAEDPAIKLLQGDVRSFSFPEGEFKFVIHAATETTLRGGAESSLGMLATIVEGTKRALDFAASHGTRKFLLTSSGAVYGKQTVTHVPENDLRGPDPLLVSSTYAEGKRTAELMCALYAKESEMECKIARCFAFVGPHLPLDAHFAIGNFIGDTLRGGPIQIRGDGTPRRSYLYAADLAVWLWTILFRAPSCEAVNVGSEDAVSIRELAAAVVAALDENVKVTIEKEPVAGQTIQTYVPSTQRAQRELHLSEQIPLGEAIRRTADWYK